MKERTIRDDMKRIPPGQPRLKLKVEGMKPGYQGYWAVPSQFEELQDGGYSFVKKEKDQVTVGTDKQGDIHLGSIVSRQANSDGSRLYLMQIKKSWYRDNQAIKQKTIDEAEHQIRHPQVGDNHYIPDGGISIQNELK